VNDLRSHLRPFNAETRGFDPGGSDSEGRELGQGAAGPAADIENRTGFHELYNLAHFQGGIERRHTQFIAKFQDATF
jgi:hypothetical protein